MEKYFLIAVVILSLVALVGCEQGDEFCVESNLKNLSVSEKDGVLKVIDKTKHNASYDGAMLKLYIPDDVVFEDAIIKTGAGQVELGYIEVFDSIDMKGGAGEIRIMDGTLNNLTLHLGVGKLDMTARLLGESDLKFGVGESDLTLIGDKDDYKFDVVNGIGQILIDEKSASVFGDGEKGENLVKIKGGIGETNIKFSSINSFCPL